ncbi:uncharacterized protein LOC119724129 [Patiria miniata]|uniref:Ribosomal protein eL8/eL30/eS12/Gadd45 domain-containing protein n=1 Tax=Patiria miniata TaxID=46514 RepID=A0A913ZIU0_PATMI|nr:uncharacterized protein LOC119724129 [Patiria miniata]
MAAPTVDSRASTVRGKKGNKNYYPVKNTITSPFLSEWPQLSHEETSLLLQKITSTFTPHAESLAKQSSKGKEKVVSDEAKTKRAFLRSQLALGLNEVTRSLEQDKLRLALVCRSAQPALMTNHLMSLSATRDTPVLCLQGLSATLAPILKLKVILAVGFKKITPADPAAFDELVNCIVGMTPPINVPWLQYKELTLDQLREVVTTAVLRVKTADKSTEKQKGKGKGKNKGQGSSGFKAPEPAQAGTSSDSQSQAGRNPDSGASPKVKGEAPMVAHPQDSAVAPEHAQSLEGIKSNVDDISEKLVLLPEEKLESQKRTVQVGETAQSQKRTDENPAKKRALSGTPPGLSKKRAKMVLRPDYKPVTVLPVKIIPKDLKDKKQLKKKRKQNKKKK